jgi:hypothetical protein
MGCPLGIDALENLGSPTRSAASLKFFSFLALSIFKPVSSDLISWASWAKLAIILTSSSA